MRLDHLRETASIRDEVGACGSQTQTVSLLPESRLADMSNKPSLFPFFTLFQESAQKQQLLSSLQEEQERLQAAHAAQLENLRFQFDKQIQEMKLEHSLMVRLQTGLLVSAVCAHTHTVDHTKCVCHLLGCRSEEAKAGGAQGRSRWRDRGATLQ